MCWCDPNIRTICCGKPECIPPKDKPNYDNLVDEPVSVGITMPDLMSMRQTCRDALSPSIVYKDGMTAEEMKESAFQARRKALVRLHDWLDNLIGDGM